MIGLSLPHKILYSMDCGAWSQGGSCTQLSDHMFPGSKPLGFRVPQTRAVRTRKRSVARVTGAAVPSEMPPPHGMPTGGGACPHGDSSEGAALPEALESADAKTATVFRCGSTVRTSVGFDPFPRRANRGNLQGGEGTKRLRNEVRVGVDHRLPSCGIHHFSRVPATNKQTF